MAITVMAVIATGCSDDFPDNGYGTVYPDGTGIVNLCVDFEPFSADDVTSRGHAGNIMKNLDDLAVVAYDSEGNLMPGFPVNITASEHQLNIEDVKRNPSDASNGVLAEKETKRATFRLNIPYGKYYLYAISNLGKRDADGTLLMNSYDVLMSMLASPDTEEAAIAANRENLLNYSTEWDLENPYNNFQMFGYFCNEELHHSPHTGAEANNVTVSVDRPNLTLYSWIRRSCSKVTVDFDGSGLDPGVTIHIRRATIHDIARSCKLGMPNKPLSANALYPFREDDRKSDSYYRPKDINTGNQIVYGEGTDHDSWPILTADHPSILSNAHAENAESLFLYENMQGDSEDPENKLQKPSPDGTVAGSTDRKDNMPYGSYIEVEGYYEYSTVGEAHQGPIYYRSMLGKDALKNFDVERNTHLKLTLKIRGLGNDVDWHIEYDRENGFEWKDPYYVSYLYNQSSTIHFRFTPEDDEEVGYLKAEIIGNAWWPDDKSEGVHEEWMKQYPFENNQPPNMVNNTFKYKDDITYTEESCKEIGDHECTLKGRPKYLGNGFLSLYSTNLVTINFDQTYVKASDSYGASDWTSLDFARNLNDRRFYGLTDNGEEPDHSQRIYMVSGTPPADGRRRSTIVEDNYSIERAEDGSLRVNIPVYTRPKNLVKQTAYSGNNPYEGSERTAWVKFTVYYKAGISGGQQQYKEGPSQIMAVKQVRRLSNPKGIYRSYNNNEPFNVQLMHQSTPTSDTFEAFRSDGPWMAEILGGSPNFITLNGRSTISGTDNTEIKFDVRFNRMNYTQDVRYAVIRVRYNNYTCVHLIFVRQGYAPQQISNDGPMWHATNMIYNGRDADDPRDEGSMFKFGNWDEGFDSSTNGLGWAYNILPGSDDFKSWAKPAAGSLNVISSRNEGLTYGKSWGDITANHTSTVDVGLATIDEYATLFGTAIVDGKTNETNIKHGFGVLYADGATKTQSTLANAWGYYRGDTDANRKEKGMRGLFVYYWDVNGNPDYNCRNIFFPIGRAGYGHRRSNDGATSDIKDSVDGTLRYAAGRNSEMDKDLSPKQPQFYDLYRRQGAIYWSAGKRTIPDVTGAILPDAVAFDINYFTFDVNVLPHSIVHKHSQWTGCDDEQCVDALFARRVERTVN